MTAHQRSTAAQIPLSPTLKNSAPLLLKYFHVLRYQKKAQQRTE